MRARAMVVSLMAVNVAAAATTAWFRLRWSADFPGRGDRTVQVDAAGIGLTWATTGAVLAWLRPRNAVGWLLVAVGGVPGRGDRTR